MNQNPTHPYTLHVWQASGGHFLWAIREHGKLLQRADRTHPSERIAREKGEAALDRLYVSARDTRYR
jgi:hypothetical protein